MNAIVTIRLLPTSAVALRAAAKLRGIAVSELIRQALDREIRSEPNAERQASTSISRGVPWSGSADSHQFLRTNRVHTGATVLQPDAAAAIGIGACSN